MSRLCYRRRGVITCQQPRRVRAHAAGGWSVAAACVHGISGPPRRSVDTVAHGHATPGPGCSGSLGAGNVTMARSTRHILGVSDVDSAPGRVSSTISGPSPAVARVSIPRIISRCVFRAIQRKVDGTVNGGCSRTDAILGGGASQSLQMPAPANRSGCLRARARCREAYDPEILPRLWQGRPSRFPSAPSLLFGRVPRATEGRNTASSPCAAPTLGALDNVDLNPVETGRQMCTSKT